MRNSAELSLHLDRQLMHARARREGLVELRRYDLLPGDLAQVVAHRRQELERVPIGIDHRMVEAAADPGGRCIGHALRAV